MGRSLDEVLGEMRMVAEGVKTAATVVDLADRHGLHMPIAQTIHDVVTGQIRAADAYRGLIRAVPAGHESDPG
jgi:glycerol-3-phosphate dehydrogenase (NAD(P)+)